MIANVTKYVRFERAGAVSYGVWDNGAVKELAGGLFDGTPTGRVFPAAETRFLVPCEPSKVLAVGLNYASHRAHVEHREEPRRPEIGAADVAAADDADSDAFHEAPRPAGPASVARPPQAAFPV